VIPLREQSIKQVLRDYPYDVAVVFLFVGFLWIANAQFQAAQSFRYAYLVWGVISTWAVCRLALVLHLHTRNENRLGTIALTNISADAFLAEVIAIPLIMSCLIFIFWIGHLATYYEIYFPDEYWKTISVTILPPLCVTAAAGSDLLAYVATTKSKARPILRMLLWFPILFGWSHLLQAGLWKVVHLMVIACVVIVALRLPVVCRRLFAFD
jgi:hypothetical protein